MISLSTAFLSSATLLFCNSVLRRVAASPRGLTDGAVLTHTTSIANNKNNRNTLFGSINTLQLQTRNHLTVGSGSRRRDTRALFGSDDACQKNNSYFDDNPLAFAYYEKSYKDFSSYFTVTKNETETDYTALLELYKAPCEFEGGTLYSISGFQTCGNTDNEDFGINYVKKNLPYCANQECIIDESTVYNSEAFKFCQDPEQATSEYQVSTVETSVMSGECKAQLGMLSLYTELENATYAEDSTIYDVSGDGSRFDYESTIANLTIACEAEGGYMYKFSDMISAGNEVSGYYGVAGNTTFMNQPLCLGTSCDATKFFEEILIPAVKFGLDGNFRHKDYDPYYPDNPPGNKTYPAEQSYTFLGFEAVSDVPAPSSSSAFSFVSIFAATLSVFISMAMI